MMIYSLLFEYNDKKLKVINCDNVESAKEVYAYERKNGIKKAFLMRSEMKEYRTEFGRNWDYVIGNFSCLDAVIFKVLEHGN